MIDLTGELYNKIVQQIINQKLNSIEAKCQLAEILEGYNIIHQENNPDKYDLKINIDKYIRDKSIQNLSPKTLKNYKNELTIFANYINKKIQENVLF
jgi:integrase/recombinase XerD